MSSNLKYTSKLKDNHVLVLGGTSGIGFCVAEAALEHGAHVCISSSTQSKLSNAISRLQSSYPDNASHISGHLCDLSNLSEMETNIDSLLQAATTNYKLDHIVFTAGDALKPIPIAEATVESVHATGTVRFMGKVMLAKLAPKYMFPGPNSSITLTGGTNSHKPVKGWAIIAAWGSGAEGLARGLAVDLAPIRVNLVSPGAVRTELFDSIPKERLDSILQGFAEASLVERVADPQDVAEAYIYAMKDRFVTGTIISTDGGRLLK